MVLPSRSLLTCVFLSAALLFLGACYATGNRPAIPQIRAQAERDLDCPGSEIRIEEELSGMFKAVGCGRKARYRAACEHLTCTVSHEDGQAIPWRDRPEPGSMDSRR